MIPDLQLAIAQYHPQPPSVIRASKALFEALLMADLIDFRYGMHLLHHPMTAIELADDLEGALFSLLP
ncbi:hypothetical protein [Chitinimonas naiadis]